MDGFLFDSLTENYQKFFRDLNKKFPEKSKEFLKTETQKYLKVAKRVAKKEVGTSKGTKKDWIDSKSYHKGFKIGKFYTFSNDLCIRAYNKSPHAHLVEYGHVNVPRSSKRATTRAGRAEQAKQKRGSGYTLGKFVFKVAEMDFSDDYLKDADAFMYNFFKDNLK